VRTKEGAETAGGRRCQETLLVGRGKDESVGKTGEKN